MLAILAGVAPSRSVADGISPLDWKGVTRTPNSWQVITDSAYGWFDETGHYTGRWMTESAFSRMAARLAYGVQSSAGNLGTGYSSNASNGVAVMSELKTAATTAGTVGALRTIKGEGLTVMQAVRSWPLLKTLGTIGLGLTTFEVGWKVGGLLNNLFFEPETNVEAPAGSYTEAYGVTEVEKGTKYASGGITFPNGALAPKDQFLVQLKAQPANVTVEAAAEPGAATPECSAGSVAPVIRRVPADGQYVNVGSSSCAGSPKTFPMVAITLPLKVSSLPGEGGKEPAKVVTGSKTTPDNASSAIPKAEECLMGLIGCSLLPGWWWNHDPEAKEATNDSTGGEALDPAEPLSRRVPSFGQHETYVQYDEKLEALEFKPENIVLPEEWVNPAYGPLEVTQVNPKPGSQLAPETGVKVRYNPETATESSPGTETGTPSGGWSPPGIPSIDLAPLTETGLGCTTFPFGVFCWFGEAVKAFAVSPVCPLDVEFPIHAFGGDDHMHVDGCSVGETVMGPVRLIVLACSTIGLVLLFAKQAMGTGGEDA